VAGGLAGAAATVVAVVHLACLGYLVFGGFLALRGLAWLWPSVAMTVWSAYVTLAGATCPLTTLEKALLEAAGRVPYEGSFIAHHLHGVLFPARYETVAWLVATGIALASYVLAFRRHRRHRLAAR
jgi:uncharacterized protein DUF2784